MGTIMIRIIQIGAALCATLYAIALVRKAKAHPEMISNKSSAGLAAVIGGTMFFDALGIGGNAPQTALFKLFKLVPDRLIPGTLNTCTLIPSTVETLLFVTLVQVDPLTLVCLIVAVAAGAGLGAKYVSHFPVKPIQIILGCGLLIVATTMVLRQIGYWPAGGEAIGLEGARLIGGTAAFFVLGLCASAGIGCYAPMMAVCYSLGMNPRSAFPIMFGGYTFLMPAAGFRFLKEGALDMKANLVGQVAGTIGVILAVFLVKELPLTILTWIVIGVLIISSIMMFHSAFKKKVEAEEEAPTQTPEETPAA